MICYKDMTFCTFYHGCSRANVCERPLTPDVAKAAEEWWVWASPTGQRAPISIFLTKPSCYEAIPPEETEPHSQGSQDAAVED